MPPLEKSIIASGQCSSQSVQNGVEEPHQADVLCGRGGSINTHPGNETFRTLVEKHKRIYLTARFKKDKREIADLIIQEIKKQGGKFLSRDAKSGLWIPVSDDKARDKTSQALRENAPKIREEMEKEKDAIREATRKEELAATALYFNNLPQKRRMENNVHETAANVYGNSPQKRRMEYEHDAHRAAAPGREHLASTMYHNSPYKTSFRQSNDMSVNYDNNQYNSPSKPTFYQSNDVRLNYDNNHQISSSQPTLHQSHDPRVNYDNIHHNSPSTPTFHQSNDVRYNYDNNHHSFPSKPTFHQSDDMRINYDHRINVIDEQEHNQSIWRRNNYENNNYRNETPDTNNSRMNHHIPKYNTNKTIMEKMAETAETMSGAFVCPSIHNVFSPATNTHQNHSSISAEDESYSISSQYSSGQKRPNESNYQNRDDYERWRKSNNIDRSLSTIYHELPTPKNSGSTKYNYSPKHTGSHNNQPNAKNWATMNPFAMSWPKSVSESRDSMVKLEEGQEVQLVARRVESLSIDFDEKESYPNNSNKACRDYRDDREVRTPPPFDEEKEDDAPMTIGCHNIVFSNLFCLATGNNYGDIDNGPICTSDNVAKDQKPTATNVDDLFEDSLASFASLDMNDDNVSLSDMKGPSLMNVFSSDGEGSKSSSTNKVSVDQLHSSEKSMTSLFVDSSFQLE